MGYKLMLRKKSKLWVKETEGTRLPRDTAADAENSGGSQKPTNTSSSFPERVLAATKTYEMEADGH